MKENYSITISKQKARIWFSTDLTAKVKEGGYTHAKATKSGRYVRIILSYSDGYKLTQAGTRLGFNDTATAKYIDSSIKLVAYPQPIEDYEVKVEIYNDVIIIAVDGITLPYGDNKTIRRYENKTYYIKVNKKDFSNALWFDPELTEEIKKRGYTHVDVLDDGNNIYLNLCSSYKGKGLKQSGNRFVLYNRVLGRTLLRKFGNKENVEIPVTLPYMNVISIINPQQKEESMEEERIKDEQPVDEQPVAEQPTTEQDNVEETATSMPQTLSDYTNEEIFAEARKRGYKDICLCTPKELYNELLKRGYEGEMSRKDILK